MNLHQKILSTTSQFLKTHCDSSRPLLVALSGGADSWALFHALRLSAHPYGLKLAVAHVDHGWRPESQAEAEDLKARIESYGIAFHQCRLDPSNLVGNLENASRQERLRFFRSLCEKESYQAVVLGHQSDDQAETVLKRVLEGASLLHLSGMDSVEFLEGVRLWRPLLSLSKTELLDWLHSLDEKHFDDPSNADQRFLRARMRTKILPELNQAFGKECQNSLLFLAEEIRAFEADLNARLSQRSIEICHGPFGKALTNDLSLFSGFEIQALLRKWSQELGFFISREGVKTATQLILAKAANKKIISGDGTVFIDRGYVFFSKKTGAPRADHNSWLLGQKTLESTSITGWQNVWRGRLAISLPEDDYWCVLANASDRLINGKKLTEWWNAHKVPAFLRAIVPVLKNRNGIAHEFLTGKTLLPIELGRECSSLTLIVERQYIIC